MEILINSDENMYVFIVIYFTITINDCCFEPLQYAVKRKAVGIWGCKDCGKVKAGGAYTLK